MSFGPAVTIDGLAFQEIDPGKYLLDVSTLDEPQYLNIERSLVPSGTSSYVIKRQYFKNSAVTGSPDDLLQVHVVIKGNMNVHTVENIDALFNQLNVFLTPEVLKRIVRGER